MREEAFGERLAIGIIFFACFVCGVLVGHEGGKNSIKETERYASVKSMYLIEEIEKRAGIEFAENLNEVASKKASDFCRHVK